MASPDGQTQFIIAHAGAGKTTAAEAGLPVIDIDDYRTPAIEAELRPLRDREQWDDHNRIYHDFLRHAISERPFEPGKIVLIHGPWDLQAVAGRSFDPTLDAVVITPRREFARRVSHVFDHESEHRAEMMVINRKSIIDWLDNDAPHGSDAVRFFAVEDAVRHLSEQ